MYHSMHLKIHCELATKSWTINLSDTAIFLITN